MASKNAPTSSADLIRKHSTARYLTVNEVKPYRGFRKVAKGGGEDLRLAERAREALARKQF